MGSVYRVEGAAKQWRLALASGVAFLLLAVASDYIVRQASGLTAIWPCNAIILALLILFADRRGAPVAILAGSMLGSFLSSVLRAQPLELCILFPIANAMESLVGAWVIRQLGGIHGGFQKVSDVIALIVASVVAPIIPAVIGAGALHGAFGGDFGEGWINWYGAAMLGIAVIVPGIVVAARWRHTPLRRLARTRQLGEAVFILGLTATVSMIVFDFDRLFRAPLLFALFPVVTLATFRLRQIGAVSAILIITIIGAQATVSNIGPIAGTGVDPARQLLMLQVFLAMMVLTALPIAAALAERDARADEARTLADQYRAVVENVDKVIFQIDRQGRWTYLNPAWELMTGYPVADTLMKPWLARIESDNPVELVEWAGPVLSGEIDQTRRLLRFATAETGVRWMEISLQTLRGPNGKPTGATGTLRDVDDRKRMEDHVLLAKRRAEERAREASLLAATDELTGLANRRAFGRHLERQIEAIDEVGGHIALAIFDVDHFKHVNDRHGHAVGDRVLQRVSSRALGVVRSGDVVGRLGGEEFGILMSGATLEIARNVAERLREAIQAPAREGEEVLPIVTVSVGIAAADPGENAATLTLEADRALYAAKADGRNRVKIAA